MKLNNLFFALAAAVMLWSCTSTEEHKIIKPLPAGYSADSLTDCTVPAVFSSDDFNMDSSSLTMTVYSEDYYDAVEVSQMQAGDTLVFQDRKIVVATINDADGILTVNGGIEEGGAYLCGGEGGTYRSLQLDDHPVYSRLGRVTLPVSGDLVIIDCGEDPDTPQDTITTDAGRYLKQATGWRRDFSELNTRVLIEHGVVTRIIRHWIP